MESNKRVTLTIVWGLAVLGMLCIVGTGVLAHRQFNGMEISGAEPTLEVFYPAPPFDLIDQNGERATEVVVKGKVYVAMVFFASCPGPCPGMIGKLAALQKAVPDPDVQIISISLDPKNDKPEMLKGYAQGMGADESRWYFLTGEKETIFATAKAFGLAAVPGTDSSMISHTQKMLLIDRQNRVRGIYESSEAGAMEKLAQDAKVLVKERAL